MYVRSYEQGEGVTWKTNKDEQGDGVTWKMNKDEQWGSVAILERTYFLWMTPYLDFKHKISKNNKSILKYETIEKTIFPFDIHCNKVSKYSVINYYETRCAFINATIVIL